MNFIYKTVHEMDFLKERIRAPGSDPTMIPFWRTYSLTLFIGLSKAIASLTELEGDVRRGDLLL